MDWLDEVVQRAAPRALGADPAAAEQAEAVARAVIAIPGRRSRFTRFWRFMGGSALGIGLVGLGVTTAAAGPVLIGWLGWTPDVVVQRSFDLGDGSALGLCEVFIRVDPVYADAAASNEEADRRTEEARRFLTEHDWEPLIASITESEVEAAYEAEAARRSEPFPDGTMPPPASRSLVASRLMGDRISAEFEREGYLEPGVGLESAGRQCGDATEGPTQ